MNKIENNGTKKAAANDSILYFTDVSFVTIQIINFQLGNTDLHGDVG